VWSRWVLARNSGVIKLRSQTPLAQCSTQELPACAPGHGLQFNTDQTSCAAPEQGLQPGMLRTKPELASPLRAISRTSRAPPTASSSFKRAAQPGHQGAQEVLLEARPSCPTDHGHHPGHQGGNRSHCQAAPSPHVVLMPLRIAPTGHTPQPSTATPLWNVKA